ncbi:MAG: hypothetical protein WA052_03615 [Microgenomates group bacterium]
MYRKINTKKQKGVNLVPFTKGEESLLGLLEEDKLFGIVVLNIRNKLGIPAKGFTSPNKDRENIKKIETKKLIRASHTLCRLYNLPVYWAPTFHIYILLNKTIKIDESLYYKPITIRKQNNKVLLEINERISIKELGRILQLNSSEYKDKTKNLPQRPTKEIKNLKIRKKISQVVSIFRDNPKPQPYKKIADFFNEIQIDQETTLDTSDESVLREYVSRNDKELNKQTDDKKLDLLKLVLGIQDIEEVIKD